MRSFPCRVWIGPLALAALIVSPPETAGGDLGVAWDASPGATGYRVRYGTDPGSLDRTVTVTTARSAVLTGLADCTRWYVSVTAYNAAGESAPSPVVSSQPRPRLDRFEPTQALQGDSFVFAIQGANLGPGTEIAIDNPGVYLQLNTADCVALGVAGVAEPTAPGRRAAEVGSFAVRVRTLDGLEAERPFEVLVDPSRFDINRSDALTTDRIDGADTVWVARRFASREGDGTYDPDSDFDGDGWIDGRELSWIGSTLGSCWNGLAWSHATCGPVPGTSE